MGPTKYHTGQETAAGKAQINYRDRIINLYTAYHALHDDLTWKFNREKFFDHRQTTCWTKQLWNTAPTDKLKQTLHAMPCPCDESARKFNRKKFTDDGRMTCWMKQQRNTALTYKFKLKQLIATVSTRKLIYALHAVPVRRFNADIQPGEIFWRRFLQQVIRRSWINFVW